MLGWRQPIESCIHELASNCSEFFFFSSCHVQALCVCVWECMFANARIVYLLISNRLVIIRLSSTAAIGVIYKNFSYSSTSKATIQRFCMRDFHYTLPLHCRESTDISFILCTFFSFSILNISHFQNGLSDCIVCTYIVPRHKYSNHRSWFERRSSFPGSIQKKHLNNIQPYCSFFASEYILM